MWSWRAFSGAHVLRRVMPEGTPALSAPPEAIAERFPPRRITGWMAFEEPSGSEEVIAAPGIDDDT